MVIVILQNVLLSLRVQVTSDTERDRKVCVSRLATLFSLWKLDVYGGGLQVGEFGIPKGYFKKPEKIIIDISQKDYEDVQVHYKPDVLIYSSDLSFSEDGTLKMLIGVPEAAETLPVEDELSRSFFFSISSISQEGISRVRDEDWINSKIEEIEEYPLFLSQPIKFCR